MSTIEAGMAQTEMSFVDPTKPVGIAYGLNIFTNEVTYLKKQVEVGNARLPDLEPDLSTQGFCLICHNTEVTDFHDKAQQDDIYKAEVEKLMAELTGADKVVVCHMQLRDNSKTARPGLRKPAFFAHIDYTEDSFAIRAREELGDSADYWLTKRFAAYNVWRGVGLIEEKPLAVCDARTVRRDDFIETPVHEKPGQPTPYVGMQLAYSPDQRWYYFPDMEPGEAIVFKQCDSDHDLIQWCPHLAIDVNSVEHPRPRVSFEARTIVFFEDR